MLKAQVDRILAPNAIDQVSPTSGEMSWVKGMEMYELDPLEHSALPPPLAPVLPHLTRLIIASPPSSRHSQLVRSHV
jgi:hypothetical protein